MFSMILSPTSPNSFAPISRGVSIGPGAIAFAVTIIALGGIWFALGLIALGIICLGELFDLSQDPVEIIKWKDIYEKLEFAIDRCEDVANIVEMLVVKQK